MNTDTSHVAVLEIILLPDVINAFSYYEQLLMLIIVQI